MQFNPGLSIGQSLTNADIVSIFKCGNMGGMRRSKETGTLVIVSDYTKGIYHDKWIGGVLHYTGMGKSGDQDIHWAQNASLAGCATNGVDVHLFEVIDPGEYVYCGRIELVYAPYKETQTGEDGQPRSVWMFPVRPVPDNDVRKPEMYVFKDMDDYIARGQHVDEEYAIRKNSKKSGSTSRVAPKPEPVVKPKVEIPPELVGRQVKHAMFGLGTISGIAGEYLVIDFGTAGVKKMGYVMCTSKGLLEFL